MVYFRNIRLFNIKLVRNLVKKVNDPVKVFNKLENIAAQVRYQVLLVQLALNFRRSVSESCSIIFIFLLVRR